MAGKKKTYSEVARLINSTKDELDKSLTRLDRHKELRESQGESLIHAPVTVLAVVAVSDCVCRV